MAVRIVEICQEDCNASTDIEEGTDTIEPWVMEAPKSIVEDSARGWVSVVGDLMGPTIEVGLVFYLFC